jgi:hypothetical protein
MVLLFTFALVTKMTDRTTIALPARMKRSTRSCRTSHPRKTATTGFTYAYVETFDVGTCSRRHTQAVSVEERLRLGVEQEHVALPMGLGERCKHGVHFAGGCAKERSPVGVVVQSAERGRCSRSSSCVVRRFLRTSEDHAVQEYRSSLDSLHSRECADPLSRFWRTYGFCGAINAIRRQSLAPHDRRIQND